jgi:hypothetical protein
MFGNFEHNTVTYNIGRIALAIIGVVIFPGSLPPALQGSLLVGQLVR